MHRDKEIDRNQRSEELLKLEGGRGGEGVIFQGEVNTLLHTMTYETNAGKFHLLVNSDKSCTAKIEDFGIKNGTKEKKLLVRYDSNLSF